MPGELMNALRELDIEPLAPSGVADYQRKKAAPGTWSGHKEGAAWFLLWVALLTLFLPYVLGMTDKYFSPSSPSLPALSVIFLAIGSIPIFCRSMYLFWDKDARGHRITRSWKYVRLTDYEGNVPEFALSKAIQIKKAVPDCLLGVEFLVEEEEKIVRPLRDPFLLVSRGSEKRYIDVWDEKEYERKL